MKLLFEWSVKRFENVLQKRRSRWPQTTEMPHEETASLTVQNAPSEDSDQRRLI